MEDIGQYTRRHGRTTCGADLDRNRNRQRVAERGHSGLYAYNDQFAGPMGNSMLTIGARDVERKIIGGLIANLQTGWKWMHLQRLWVDESHRRAGIGRLLVEAAEKEGTETRMPACVCRYLRVSGTWVLRKAGYSVYAVMEDYPVGHRKFLLRKTF